MSKKKPFFVRAIRFFLPMFFIVLGIFIFKALLNTKPKARRSNSKSEARIVELTQLKKETKRIRIKGNGTVIPAQTLQLKPQVSGQVIWQNEKIAPGGIVGKGELLFKIEDLDYRLALSQKEAVFSQAELAFELEKAKASVAAKEWTFASRVKGVSDKKKKLILREPYLKVAEANYKSAESGLEKARLNLRRTKVKAPFNALIQSENLEVGQLVSIQTASAVLIGTDKFWVQVSVPYSELEWIQIPDESSKKGSEVIIKQFHGGKTMLEKRGHVVRLIGELDKIGRMAKLLVEIEDPMALSAANKEMPLLLGSYVDVEILAAKNEEFYVLPRVYLRDSNKIWLFSDKSELEIRELEISWSDRKNIYFKNGIEENAKVVKTRIFVPIPGMKLRTGDQQNDAPEEKSETAQVK